MIKLLCITNQKRKPYIRVICSFLFIFVTLIAVTIMSAGARASSSSLMINVKDYGATGDGTSDDSLAIKEALAAAQEGNQTLYFPAGKYNLNYMSFIAKNDLTMIGESTSSTQLIEPANFCCYGNVTVSNMSVSDSSGEFLYLVPKKPITLKVSNMIYTSPIDYGNNSKFVYCYTESTTGYMSHVEITDCDISNCQYGILLACRIDSGLISRNSIYKLGNPSSSRSVDGILLGYPNSKTVFASNITVSNNKIHDLTTKFSNKAETNECQGILLYGNGGSVIENNYLQNITGGYDHEGIYCKSEDVRILNNTLINTGDGDGSIVVKKNSHNNDIIISGNTIINEFTSAHELHGILVTGQKFTINKNNIDMISGIAIYAAIVNNGVLDGSVTNNNIQTAGRTAIYLTRTSGTATISGNTITQNFQSGEKQDCAINLIGAKSSAVINMTQNIISIGNTNLLNMYNTSTSAAYNITDNIFSTNGAFTDDLYGLKGSILTDIKANNTILGNMIFDN